MLELAEGRVWLRGEEGRKPIDVIYRRTDSDRLQLERDEASELAHLLGESMANGTVAVVNAFGTGVADDKLAQRYVDEMIRFYLASEPIIASVPTLRPRNSRKTASSPWTNLERLVVKPRCGLAAAGSSSAPRRRASSSTS